jgi:hypothetical protein
LSKAALSRGVETVYKSPNFGHFANVASVLMQNACAAFVSWAMLPNTAVSDVGIFDQT